MFCNGACFKRVLYGCMENMVALANTVIMVFCTPIDHPMSVGRIQSFVPVKRKIVSYLPR